LDSIRFILGDFKLVHAFTVTNIGVSMIGYAQTDKSAYPLVSGITHIVAHINARNADRYDYQILIQGTKKTVQYQVDRHEPMHLKEMAAFLSGKYGPLATLEDGIANLELLRQAMIPGGAAA